jgi:hypothetical protein
MAAIDRPTLVNIFKGVCEAVGYFGGVCLKIRKSIKLIEKYSTNWACEDGIPYPFPYICFGLSSFMSRLRAKFNTSQLICPANMSIISASLVDQMRVA